jgi:hypothetical protein
MVCACNLESWSRMYRTLKILAGVVMAFPGFAAQAEVIRCQVQNPSLSVMPAWIEYEVNTRGTSVKVRDAVREGIGIGWIDGTVVRNNGSQFIFTYDDGFLPYDAYENDEGRIEMRLTRLANGRVFVTSFPLDARVLGQSFRSDANCSP